MILSDRDIKKTLKDGKLKVEPMEEKQIMQVGIDLRLGNDFKRFMMGTKSHIDPAKDKVDDSTESFRVEEGESLMLHPGEFVLGITKEYVELPDDLAARIDGRSSLGRLGIIVHSTAGHVDPGFKGRLVLEISNIGKLPVCLVPNMKFCSLIFEEVSSPVENPYKGKYLGQKTPVSSKIGEEFKKK